MPYDLSEYGRSLHHHGTSTGIHGWNTPIIRRSIQDSTYFDAIGPWPYATLPNTITKIEALRSALTDNGFISFCAWARPDQRINHEAWRTAGFEAVPLKPHFVHRPHLLPPARSAKTRANLSKATRYWETKIIPATRANMEQFSHWHESLNKRKDMSRFAQLTSDHFYQLVNLPECQLMAAGKADDYAAAVVLMVGKHEVHCHAQSGADLAYSHRAFYALYDAILKHWGQTHTIYLGGAPGGQDGPGIARFKRRFANDTSDVTMVRAILNPEVSRQLAQKRGTPGWFPPYRSRVD